MRGRFLRIFLGTAGIAAACAPEFAVDNDKPDASTPDASVDAPVDHTVADAPIDSPADTQADVTDAGIDANEAGPPAITQIVAGRFDTCVLRDGKVYCWGILNQVGELGAPPSDASVPEPRLVDNAVSAVFGAPQELALSKPQSFDRAFGCALTDASVFCWGDNSGNQLGNGTYTPSAIPVPIPWLQGGTLAVKLGAGHGCGLVDPGDASTVSNVYCWGFTGGEALGPRSAEAQGTHVVGIPAFKLLAAGTFSTCGIPVNAPNQLVCWGYGTGYVSGIINPDAGPPDAGTCVSSDYGSCTPRVITLPNGVVPKAVAMSGTFACILTQAGEVHCWGNDDLLTLGVDIDAGCPFEYMGKCTPLPQKVPLEKPATTLVVGLNHACAILEDKTVQCWGRNQEGQLGAGIDSDYNAPLYVVDPAQLRNHLGGVDLIAAGESHTCAVVGQKIYCWGAPIVHADGGKTNAPQLMITPW